MRLFSPLIAAGLAAGLLSGLAGSGSAHAGTVAPAAGQAQPGGKANPETAPRTVAGWIALGDRQLSQGSAAAAVLIFGAVAARQPDYPPAQEGLDRAFARFGPVGRAEGFLRYALAEDPARERALLAAWQALDRAHPLRFSGSASILPSSNVDHVASERYLVTDFGTFLIDGGGQESTGVGLGYSLGVDYILHSRPGARVRLHAGYAGAWLDAAPLRYGEPSLGITYERLGGRAPWSLEAFASRRRYGGTGQVVTADNTARGLELRKAWRPGRGGRVLLDLGAVYRRYSEKPYLTGPTYDLDLSRIRPVAAHGRISYGLHLQRGRPRKNYHRYSGLELRVGYARPVVPGLQLSVTLGLGQRFYDTAFPIVGERRRDRTLSLGIGAKLSRLKIFGRTPRLSCTAWRTRSNIALYTIGSVDCAMTLTLDF